MLEKESELSGAVVGGAADQQDQGEESPIAAAEMEQRIGLMGRLNDAAARLHQQPAPEVADHDADLWYAACFACTTSLQVVRLFRRQRVELPQRDPIREAYLVVLAQLAMEAEESRERLEDTAIPNIDDGLADARAALLAEAHAAIDEMAETVHADLRAFNQDLPVDIRPAMRGLPPVTERAAALVVGPADFYVGRFDEWDPNPPYAAGGLYIVYYYRGAKLDFPHFKRRKPGNRQVGGTERLGVPAYRGRRPTLKNPPTPATGGVAPGQWRPRRSATACRTRLLGAGSWGAVFATRGRPGWSRRRFPAGRAWCGRWPGRTTGVGFPRPGGSAPPER